MCSNRSATSSVEAHWASEYCAVALQRQTHGERDANAFHRLLEAV
jgi:hypothetical protein